MPENEYINVSRGLARVCGKRDEGTRIHRRTGDVDAFQMWYEAVCERVEGGVLPFTWVPRYVRVSRTAVHKRVKEGRLTAFLFEFDVAGLRRVLDGRAKNQYVLVPLTEVKAWAANMEDRRERSGKAEAK